jgi:cyclase
MSRKRIIPVLLHKNGRLILSRGFKTHHNIGNAEHITDRLKNWDVDELIYLDITPHWSHENADKIFDQFIETLETISKNCFVPLSAGGGINSIERINRLIHAGADRVVINSAFFEIPDLITRAAQTFGAQAIIVGLDVDSDGQCHIQGAYKSTNIDYITAAKRAEELGAGEIFLQSITRDGSATGYDLEQIKKLSSAIKIPVIACGGCGSHNDFSTALNSGARAAAAANIFAFTELSYKSGKDQTIKNNIALRPAGIGVDYAAARRERENPSSFGAKENALWQILDKGTLTG